MITMQLATLEQLITGYQLYATNEEKSPNAIAIVTNNPKSRVPQALPVGE